jgi:HEAT repeat protein
MKFDEGAWRDIAGSRWKYLARMQPYVTVRAFVESYSPIEKTNYTTKTALTKLEPEFQLEVLTALVAKSEEMLSHSKTRSHSFNIYRMDRDEFAEMARQVPCEKSAELMMQWLTEKAEDHAKRVSRTKSLANSNQLPEQHLIALANSSDANLRKLVLPAIEKLPTPNRRVILKQLLSDRDPSVKKEAEDVQTMLDAIRNQTYPKRN